MCVYVCITYRKSRAAAQLTEKNLMDAKSECYNPGGSGVATRAAGALIFKLKCKSRGVKRREIYCGLVEISTRVICLIENLLN